MSEKVTIWVEKNSQENVVFTFFLAKINNLFLLIIKTNKGNINEVTIKKAIN